MFFHKYIGTNNIFLNYTCEIRENQVRTRQAQVQDCSVRYSKVTIICTPWRLFLITQESLLVIRNKFSVTKIDKTD